MEIFDVEFSSYLHYLLVKPQGSKIIEKGHGMKGKDIKSNWMTLGHERGQEPFIAGI